MNEKTEILCVAWLSSCQQHSILKNLYYYGIGAAVNSFEEKENKILGDIEKELIEKELIEKENKILGDIEKELIKKATKNKLQKLWEKLIKLRAKKGKIDVQDLFKSSQATSVVEKMLDSAKFITVNPVVGAIAVKYPNNFFSVFVGIARGKDEERDIAYIKSMEQRPTEIIARGIFPQFDGMAYRK